MKYGIQPQYFWKWKTTSIYFQWNFVLGSLGNLIFVFNIVSTQLDEIWEITYFFLKFSVDKKKVVCLEDKIEVVFHLQKLLGHLPFS